MFSHTNQQHNVSTAHILACSKKNGKGLEKYIYYNKYDK